MPDLTQKQPGDSHSKWSKDGARLKATQDSTLEWRELGAQVGGHRVDTAVSAFSAVILLDRTEQGAAQRLRK